MNITMNWAEYKKAGCAWKNGYYVIPNYREYDLVASRFESLPELVKWYPDPKLTKQKDAIQRVAKRRKEEAISGLKGRSRSARGKEGNKREPKQTKEKEQKKRRAPKHLFSVGNKVRASFKKSRKKYPGVVVEADVD